MQAFALFESGGTGRKLGIQALGSELFSHNAMPDITSSKVNNRVLLKCIKSLNEFEDEKHNLSFINYRALDVEELGSVYEGLLELEPVFVWENGKPRFTFKKGSERSSSGSHYTPEDLVKPLIQHSLEYLIEDRIVDFYKGKVNNTETVRKLLDLKVCDVACGSGHILLSAARRIALEVARVETGEQQPNPDSFRHALKEVIKNCIYGVDKNPLAVELCKVALWLESHNPGEPLSFLDHRIKCGDAIVGLVHREELQMGIADEAYKALPDDEKEIASTFLKNNKQERILREKSGQVVQLTTEADHKLIEQVKELNRLIENFSTLPENTPEEIEKKEKAYRILVNSDSLRRLKILADLQIMPFFLSKTENNKEFLLTDAQYHRYLRGEAKIPSNIELKAIDVASINRIFHWFLEFPEIFQRSGFDCILGNPPYLGGKRISGNYGDYYHLFLKSYYNPSLGSVDLVSYFVRRDFNIIKKAAFLSLITTNTISQGDTRTASLEYILSNNGQIIFATSSQMWPGKANVYVSIISISNVDIGKPKILNGGKVKSINSYLDSSSSINPEVLYNNLGKSFMGSIPLGLGFVLNKEEVNKLLNKDPNNNNVIFSYLNGDDVNTSTTQVSDRWIINFFDWPLKRKSQYLEMIGDEINVPKDPSRYVVSDSYSLPTAADYPDLLDIIINKVKHERDKQKDKGYREKWWQFARRGVDLYIAIQNMPKILVTARTSKTGAFVFVKSNQVLNANLTVFALNSFCQFSILQSNVHNSWAWKYATKLKTDLIYQPTDVFETFPFPQVLSSAIDKQLEQIGEQYHEFRRQLMIKMQLGLTKTYNAFHSKELHKSLPSTQKLTNLDKKSIEKQLGKEVWNLWKHLQKTEDNCSFEDAVAGIIKLRELHVEMDNAVLEAYTWQDIDLRHDFYEVDYLPENDRVRYTIHPDARKEVLKRLLDLNHRIHEEEVKEGLWAKKTGTKKAGKEKSTRDQLNEPEEGYGGLFG
jgi:hypothetical protein